MSILPPLASPRKRLFEYLRQEDVAITHAAQAKRLRSRALTPDEAARIKMVAVRSLQR